MLSRKTFAAGCGGLTDYSLVVEVRTTESVPGWYKRFSASTASRVALLGPWKCLRAYKNQSRTPRSAITPRTATE